MSKILVMDDALGLTEGHQEVRELINRYLELLDRGAVDCLDGAAFPAAEAKDSHRAN